MLALKFEINKNGLKYYFISLYQKASASEAWGDLVPQTPYHVLYLIKIKQFPDIKYLISTFHECGQLHEHGLESRPVHVVIYIKCLPQICTNRNGFKFDFSKKNWKRGSSPP